MSYNISNLFLEAFGLKVSKAFQPEVGDGLANNPQLDYNGVNFVDEAEATKYSFLGTPIIYPIKFKGGQYKIFKDGAVETKRMEDFRLPVTCIVDFDRDKIIGKTKINSNAGGTVKETFGFDDWNIVIRGFCLNDPYQEQAFFSAIDQEEALMQWDELVDSIEVRGQLFKIRDISNLVIKKIPMNALRGKPNVRPFTIHAWSDEPLELIL